MGAAHYSKEQSQAVAEKAIAVAEARKDAVAFISPYRQAFLNDSSVGSVTVNNIDTMTDNVVGFYAPISSTTFGVFDSGYKYMFDRFNNTFRYVPLNGDIAGTCARTDIEQFPWFSPAGTARGAILNSVKLIYNPVRNREIFYIQIELTLLSYHLVLVLYSSETKQHLVSLQHLIVSTFVDCSSSLKMRSQQQRKINYLSSTMNLQGQTL